eukprot:TRINITY_DN8430_c0_g1_i1.p1 TRINITY_DN8430_c0_g1~~TRINITY_DN8430_c0_g1_i1.p1  ORF type:complete len:200 (+),score=35.13 TRINITY_DN8430_c0_g1_i1:44-643(+)
MSPAFRYDEAWRQRVMGETRAQVAAVEGKRKPNEFEPLPLLPTTATVKKWNDEATTVSSFSDRKSISSQAQSQRAQSLSHHSLSKSTSSRKSKSKKSCSSSQIELPSQHSSASRRSSVGSKKVPTEESSFVCTTSSTSLVTTANSTIESRLLHLEDQLIEEKRGRKAVQQELDQIKRLMNEKFHIKPSQIVQKKTQVVG